LADDSPALLPEGSASLSPP